MMSTGKTFHVQEVGAFRLGLEPVKELAAGGVGYVIASIKEIGDAPVGDTITGAANPAEKLPARLPSRQAGGLLRPLSLGECGLPAAAHGAWRSSA